MSTEQLSTQKIKDLHKNGHLVGVSVLSNKNTFLSLVDVVWFDKSGEKFPFELDFDLNLKNRISFARVKAKFQNRIFDCLPIISKQGTVVYDDHLLVYSELRPKNDVHKNVWKTIEYLKIQNWVGVVHPLDDDSLKVFLLPTSSLTHELGITTKVGYPHMLHALFIKKIKPTPPSLIISEATPSELSDTPTELERFENRKRKSITEKGDDAFKKMKTESDFDEHEVLVLRVPEVEYMSIADCGVNEDEEQYDIQCISQVITSIVEADSSQPDTTVNESEITTSFVDSTNNELIIISSEDTTSSMEVICDEQGVQVVTPKDEDLLMPSDEISIVYEEPVSSNTDETAGQGNEKPSRRVSLAEYKKRRKGLDEHDSHVITLTQDASIRPPPQNSSSGHVISSHLTDPSNRLRKPSQGITIKLSSSRNVKHEVNNNTTTNILLPTQSTAPVTNVTCTVDSQTTATNDSQTKSITTATNDSQTKSITAATNDSQTKSITTATNDSQTKFITAATNDSQTKSITAATNDSQTKSITTATNDSHTKSITAATNDSQTKSITAATNDSQTKSITTATNDSQTKSITTATNVRLSQSIIPPLKTLAYQSCSTAIKKRKRPPVKSISKATSKSSTLVQPSTTTSLVATATTSVVSSSAVIVPSQQVVQPHANNSAYISPAAVPSLPMYPSSVIPPAAMPATPMISAHPHIYQNPYQAHPLHPPTYYHRAQSQWSTPLHPNEFQQLSTILQAGELFQRSLAKTRTSRSYSRSHSRSHSYSRSRSPSPRRSRKHYSTRSVSPAGTHSKDQSCQCQPKMADTSVQTYLFKTRSRSCQTNQVSLANHGVQVNVAPPTRESHAQTFLKVSNVMIQTELNITVADGLLSLVGRTNESNDMYETLVKQTADWLENKLKSHCNPNSLPHSPLSGCSRISEGNWSDDSPKYDDLCKGIDIMDTGQTTHIANEEQDTSINGQEQTTPITNNQTQDTCCDIQTNNQAQATPVNIQTQATPIDNNQTQTRATNNMTDATPTNNDVQTTPTNNEVQTTPTSNQVQSVSVTLSTSVTTSSGNTSTKSITTSSDITSTKSITTSSDVTSTKSITTSSDITSTKSITTSSDITSITASSDITSSDIIDMILDTTFSGPTHQSSHKKLPWRRSLSPDEFILPPPPPVTINMTTAVTTPNDTIVPPPPKKMKEEISKKVRSFSVSSLSEALLINRSLASTFSTAGSSTVSPRRLSTRLGLTPLPKKSVITAADILAKVKAKKNLQYEETRAGVAMVTQSVATTTATLPQSCVLMKDVTSTGLVLSTSPTAAICTSILGQPGIASNTPAGPPLKSPSPPSNTPAGPPLKPSSPPSNTPAGPLLKSPSLPSKTPAGPPLKSPSPPSNTPAGPLLKSPSPLSKTPAGPLLKPSSSSSKTPAGLPLKSPSPPSKAPAGPPLKSPSPPSKTPAGPPLKSPSPPSKIPAGPLLKSPSPPSNTPAGPPLKPSSSSSKTPAGPPLKSLSPPSKIPAGPLLKSPSPPSKTGPALKPSSSSSKTPAGPPLKSLSPPSKIPAGLPLKSPSPPSKTGPALKPSSSSSKTPAGPPLKSPGFPSKTAPPLKYPSPPGPPLKPPGPPLKPPSPPGPPLKPPSPPSKIPAGPPLKPPSPPPVNSPSLLLKSPPASTNILLTNTALKQPSQSISSSLDCTSTTLHQSQPVVIKSASAIDSPSLVISHPAPIPSTRSLTIDLEDLKERAKDHIRQRKSSSPKELTPKQKFFPHSTDSHSKQQQSQSLTATPESTVAREPVLFQTKPTSFNSTSVLPVTTSHPVQCTESSSTSVPVLLGTTNSLPHCVVTNSVPISSSLCNVIDLTAYEDMSEELKYCKSPNQNDPCYQSPLMESGSDSKYDSSNQSDKGPADMNLCVSSSSHNSDSVFEDMPLEDVILPVSLEYSVPLQECSAAKQSSISLVSVKSLEESHDTSHDQMVKRRKIDPQSTGSVLNDNTRDGMRDAAATLIQKNWKMYSSRRRYRLMKKSTVLIQLIVRGWLARCRYKATINSCVLVQSRIRGYLARIRYKQTLSSIIALQKCIRRALIRKKYQEMNMSAVKIQTLYRQHRLRCRYLKMKTGIVKFQSMYRGYKARQSYRCLMRAVVLCQALYRGYKSRQMYRKLKMGVVKFQAMYRGYKVRQMYRKLRVGVVKFQALFRGYKNRMHYKKLRLNVIKIQSFYRSYSARKYYSELKAATIKCQVLYRRKKQLIAYAQTKSNVIKIQSLVRGFLTRSLIRKQEKAATLIQSSFRCFTVHQKYKQMKNAAVTIQRYYRGYYERNMVNIWHKSSMNIQSCYCGYCYRKGNVKSVAIQSCFRGYLVRKDYCVIRRAVINIQKHYRGLVVRREFAKLKKAAIFVQRKYRQKKMVETCDASSTSTSSWAPSENSPTSSCCSPVSKKEPVVFKWRGYRTRRNINVQAAVVIQSYYRNYRMNKLVRQQFLKIRKSAVTIQRWWRAKLVKNKALVANDSSLNNTLTSNPNTPSTVSINVKAPTNVTDVKEIRSQVTSQSAAKGSLNEQQNKFILAIPVSISGQHVVASASSTASNESGTSSAASQQNTSLYLVLKPSSDQKSYVATLSHTHPLEQKSNAATSAATSSKKPAAVKAPKRLGNKRKPRKVKSNAATRKKSRKGSSKVDAIGEKQSNTYEAVPIPFIATDPTTDILLASSSDHETSPSTEDTINEQVPVATNDVETSSTDTVLMTSSRDSTVLTTSSTDSAAIDSTVLASAIDSAILTTSSTDSAAIDSTVLTTSSTDSAVLTTSSTDSAAIDSTVLASAIDSTVLATAIDSTVLATAIDSTVLASATDSTVLASAIDSTVLTTSSTDSTVLASAIDSTVLTTSSTDSTVLATSSTDTSVSTSFIDSTVIDSTALATSSTDSPILATSSTDSTVLTTSSTDTFVSTSFIDSTVIDSTALASATDSTVLATSSTDSTVLTTSSTDTFVSTSFIDSTVIDSTALASATDSTVLTTSSTDSTVLPSAIDSTVLATSSIDSTVLATSSTDSTEDCTVLTSSSTDTIAILSKPSISISSSDNIATSSVASTADPTPSTIATGSKMSSDTTATSSATNSTAATVDLTLFASSDILTTSSVHSKPSCNNVVASSAVAYSSVAKQKSSRLSQNTNKMPTAIYTNAQVAPPSDLLVTSSQSHSALQPLFIEPLFDSQPSLSTTTAVQNDRTPAITTNNLMTNATALSPKVDKAEDIIILTPITTTTSTTSSSTTKPSLIQPALMSLSAGIQSLQKNVLSTAPIMSTAPSFNTRPMTYHQSNRGGRNHYSYFPYRPYYNGPPYSYPHHHYPPHHSPPLPRSRQPPPLFQTPMGPPHWRHSEGRYIPDTYAEFLQIIHDGYYLGPPPPPPPPW